MVQNVVYFQQVETLLPMGGKNASDEWKECFRQVEARLFHGDYFRDGKRIVLYTETDVIFAKGHSEDLVLMDLGLRTWIP